MASFFIKIVVHGQGQQLHLKQTPSQLCHCQFCEIFMERQFYRTNVSGCFSEKTARNPFAYFANIIVYRQNNSHYFIGE